MSKNETLSANQETVELKWREVVSNIDRGSKSALVQVSHVDPTTLHSNVEIRVGDELFLHDVMVNDVRISLCKTTQISNDFNGNTQDSMVLPINFRGSFAVCPYYSKDHVFCSIGDLIDVYPFVGDFIFPKESFMIEGVRIPEYELLQVVTMIQDSTKNQLLEVNIVMKKRHVLLPASLQVEFMQYDDSSNIQETVTARRQNPRLYSLTELSNYFCTEYQPIKIKLSMKKQYTECPKPPVSPSKDPLKKFISIFKHKEKHPIEIIEEPQCDYEMAFSDAWWSGPLLLEPVHVVFASNQNSGSKMTVPGDLDIKVKVIEPERTNSTNSSGTVGSESSEASDRSSSVATEETTTLQQLNLTSLLNSKTRNDAIVAMITGGVYRNHNSLSVGTWLAIHRVRRVRKLLLTSKDQQTQHFLLSAQYGGVFIRQPITFNHAGDVPISNDDVYVAQCSAYPIQKNLDACYRGKFVWFQKKSSVLIQGATLQVVHCKVADSIDGVQSPATYPLNLRGKFQKVDFLSPNMSIQDLFRQKLPCNVKLKHPDPNIGFDPLEKKECFAVAKTVSEMMAIIEIVKKTEDEGLKSAGTLLEVPVSRSHFVLKEINSNTNRSLESYSRKKDYKGLQKLPSVELLADQDITMIEDASRNTTSCTLSPQWVDKEQLHSEFSSPHSSMSSRSRTNSSCSSCIVTANDLLSAPPSADAARGSPTFSLKPDSATGKSSFSEYENVTLYCNASEVSSLCEASVSTNSSLNNNAIKKPIPKPRRRHKDPTPSNPNFSSPQLTGGPPEEENKTNFEGVNSSPSGFSSLEYEYISFTTKY